MAKTVLKTLQKARGRISDFHTWKYCSQNSSFLELFDKKKKRPGQYCESVFLLLGGIFASESTNLYWDFHDMIERMEYLFRCNDDQFRFDEYKNFLEQEPYLPYSIVLALELFYINGATEGGSAYEQTHKNVLCLFDIAIIHAEQAGI